ncbi:HAD family hydrolase [Marihabitans asiaticum]|uniref:HAD superfamily hydrolase (TIGR01509 family) n=1 Tax=Marihabitans asiaticum TaxID=415218 RepID=A0A560WGZ6_9MICO|nr:HAD family phosphatase [Marihabitans asiaticum]TWD16939.1 HAD superfamily hydrolase (TIGR01509 family) [Marihabitans asiaticum]
MVAPGRGTGAGWLVVLDCDGVLVDSERLNLRTWQSMLAELGQEWSDEDVIATFIGKAYADNRPRIAELAGGEIDPEQERLWRGRFRESHEHLEVIDGAREAIEQLVGHGYAVCVASGSIRRALEYKLERTGLADLLPPEARFSSEQVERGKPAPDVFLLAAEQMGVDPARCVVVEDSLSGVQAGRAAGMQVIGYETDMTLHDWFADATAVIHTMADLPRAVQDLTA